VRGLSKRFGGIVAADEVTFDVEVGECVGLIGPNGAGKTTLFGLIAGEVEPDAGVVLLDDRSIGRLPAHRRARLGLARTYQRLEVFPDMTVLDHLLVAQLAHRGSTGVARDLLGRGRPTVDEVDRAMTVLERVGLSEHAERIVGTLSLGLCRLVEVARALVTSPSVLLADEPSSGLDHAETRVLGDLFRDLVDGGLAIVLVEHDLDLVAQVTDRVVVLDLGKVVAIGPYGQVVRDPAVRAAYLGTSP
jgi:branched-chain amino acid transport system ATP-binding protein